jgi:anti-anti-sigma factor
LRKQGCCLVLIEPSGVVLDALRALKLERFFLIARDVIQARELIQEQNAAPHKKREQLLLRGEITTRNGPFVWQEMQRLLSYACSHGSVTLDMSAVRFIDSAGAMLLLRAQRLAQKQGAKLCLIGVQKDVRNVLEHAELDQLLLGGEE